MFGHGPQVPEMVPQLSRGKHRNPRKGACFMEMASYLAGEKWSDHPACTHPLLGAVARLVNDHTSDEARGELIVMIPSVIGLTSDDPHVDIEIMLRAAATALPVVAEERQRVLAVAVLAGERARNTLDGRSADRLGGRSTRALERVPHAAQWAASFTQEVWTSPKGVQRYGAPGAVRHAVVGIAEACIPDPDRMLRELLAGAIDDCERWADRPAAPTRPTPPLAPRTRRQGGTLTPGAA